MGKFLKYLRIGIICGWRVVFEYFAWILPCSRHPERRLIAERYAKARSLVVFVLRHMGFDFRVEGLELLKTNEPTLFIGNHTSALDPLLLIALSPKPVSFIAKMESKKLIVAGRFIKAIDGIFLDREDPFQAVKAFRLAAKNMKTQGLSYCVFPEGTRQKDPSGGKTLEFHAGSFKLASMAKCPVVTFASIGARHAFSSGPFRGHAVFLTALKRREYDDYRDLNTVTFASLAQSEIEEALPNLLALDQAQEAKKSKEKPAKWWKELPQ